MNWLRSCAFWSHRERLERIGRTSRAAEAPHHSAGAGSFAITPDSLLACDFLVVVTAGFRQLYVFVLMEIGTRRIVHCNVTAHPTAAWTLQQFREALPGEQGDRFVIHDRDAIFSASLDEELKNSFGLRVLRTPGRAPKAKGYCERLIGTMRREFLDFVIPLGERHLRSLLKEWVAHYNQSRPHSRLGRPIQEPTHLVPLPSSGRHALLGGLASPGSPSAGWIKP